MHSIQKAWIAFTGFFKFAIQIYFLVVYAFDMLDSKHNHNHIQNDTLHPNHGWPKANNIKNNIPVVNK